MVNRVSVDTDPVNLICAYNAKHSIVVRHTQVGRNEKLVYRLCELHFYLAKDKWKPSDKECTADVQIAGNNEIVKPTNQRLIDQLRQGAIILPARIRFRKNRL